MRPMCRVRVEAVEFLLDALLLSSLDLCPPAKPRVVGTSRVLRHEDLAGVYLNLYPQLPSVSAPNVILHAIRTQPTQPCRAQSVHSGVNASQSSGQSP